MRKKFLCFFAAAALLLSTGTAAFAEKLVPGGSAVGIRMTTDGVVIAELLTLELNGKSVSPAADAGLKKGDVITKLNGHEVHSSEDFLSAVAKLDGGPAQITVLRGHKEKQLTVQPAVCEDGAKLGIALRGGICGVGTLTFYDPETGLYGALGHSISDADTGTVLPLGDGTVYKAEIVSIDKGRVGAPGALNGRSDEVKSLGDIRLNCGCGIFGAGDFDGEPIETGALAPGKATILCTLGDDGVKEYEITVKKVFDGGGYEAALLTVTDPELLALTGGIVQGMSGSPILQDGKLVGAVTHVFVNDPASGYGISIGDMLRTEQSLEKAA